MFIFVIDGEKREQSGYLVILDEREQIGEDISTGSVYIDSPDNSASKISVNGSQYNLYSFGSIALAAYNKSVDSFIEKGGDISKLGKTKNKVNFDNPVPAWVFSQKESEKKDRLNKLFETIKNYDYRDGFYLRPKLISCGNDNFLMFEVESLEELYFYDAQKIRDLGIEIGTCKFCGHAFVKLTRAKMCGKCRAEKKGKRENQETWRSNELNREYAKFTNTLRKRNSHSENPSYYAWITSKREDGIITLDWLTQWKEKDRAYQKIYRHYVRKAQYYSCNDESVEAWNKVKNKFPHSVDNIDTFLTEWLSKIESDKIE